MNEIAPQDVRQHLMLNQSRLSTAEEVAHEIEGYWDATEEFSRDDENQAGFIAPVGKGFAKGAKLHSESLVDTVIGVGESAIKKPSVGLNNST